jgi:hypothetical protein
MNLKKIVLLIGIILVVTILIIFIPFERIYIKESEPTQFLPSEKPIGLVEAYNNYVVLSYGTLLKQNQVEFYTQVFKFNSSDYASSYFLKAIEAFKKLGFNVNLTSYNNMQKAIIITNQYGKERYSIFVLKENKIFYITGDKTKIEKVVEWLINQKS